MLLKERARRPSATVEWSLFKDPKFLLIFVGSGIATFPLLVPPLFIPLYAPSLGISTRVGSALLAVFNLSSAFGRVGFGQLSDLVGPVSCHGCQCFEHAGHLARVQLTHPIRCVHYHQRVREWRILFDHAFRCWPYIWTDSGSCCIGYVVTAWGAGYIMGAPVAVYILVEQKLAERLSVLRYIMRGTCHLEAPCLLSWLIIATGKFFSFA